MLDLDPPNDRIESLQLNSEETLDDLLMCDIEDNTQVNNPHAADRVLRGAPFDVRYRRGGEPHQGDGLPDADGGEGGAPVPREGGLHLTYVVGVALPLELGRDAIGQNFVVIAGLGVDSIVFSLSFGLN